MGSVPEDRRKQTLLEVWRVWRQLPNERQLRDWTNDEFRRAEEATLSRMAELCEHEIREAVSEDLDGAELCDIYVFVVDGVESVGGAGLSVIYTSVRRAANTVAQSGRSVHDHAQTCVTEAVGEEKSRRVAYMNGLKPRELLSALVSTTLRRAALLTKYLGSEQQHVLSRLLYRELGNKPMPLRLDRELELPAEPTLKQRYAWLHWYLWCLKMHSLEMRQRLGGVPRIIVVSDGDVLPTNKKTGDPVDPLGPIHAKTYERLGRELNKHGPPIKDPESKSRIAKSVGVSRPTLQRYLKADLPIKLTPDNKGGVYEEYTMNDVLTALETSSRKKRSKHKPEYS